MTETNYYSSKLFLFIYWLFYFLCNNCFNCSSTVVSIFLPPLPPTAPTHTSTLNPSPLWLCPRVLYTCSLTNLPLLFPIILLPAPLWLLSICS